METTVPLGHLDPLLSLAIMALGVMVVAFFSSSEAALISVNKIRIRRLASEGHGNAQAVERLVANHERLFATILLTENAWIIFSSSVATTFFHTLLPGGTELVATLIMTVLVVILGEITPKTFAAQNAERLALLVARPIELWTRIVRPIIWLFTLVTNFLLRLLRSRAGSRSPFVTEEEIRMLVDIGEREGTVEDVEGAMVHRVFEFGDRRVAEAMIPRPDIVGLPVQATIGDLLQTFGQSSHARFPVYGEDLDDIVGIISIKDVMLALSQGATYDSGIRDLVRPVMFVPESKRIGQLFAEMQRANVQMAIILDEYGGTAGLVTTEELVEEIVGTLSDELFTGAEEVQPIDERTYRVDAGMRVDEVNEELALNLPESEDYETVAGFILAQLGHIPRQGEELRYQNLRLVVTEMAGVKIETVTITKTEGGTLRVKDETRARGSSAALP